MMVAAMRSFWKVFVALALMLPLGAFVAGNLVASAADDPAPRDTIIIDDTSGTPSGDPSPSSTPTGTPSSSPSASPTHDQGDDHGGDQGDDGGGGLPSVPSSYQRPPTRGSRMRAAIGALLMWCSGCHHEPI